MKRRRKENERDPVQRVRNKKQGCRIQSLTLPVGSMQALRHLFPFFPQFLLISFLMFLSYFVSPFCGILKVFLCVGVIILCWQSLISKNTDCMPFFYSRHFANALGGNDRHFALSFFPVIYMLLSSFPCRSQTTAGLGYHGSGHFTGG